MERLVSERWVVKVQEPGDNESYQVGDNFRERASAVWFRDKCVIPRMSRGGNGYRGAKVFRATKVMLVRRETREFTEETIGGAQ